jgi:thiol-disulfide isomerase/thioredoxin
MALKNPLLLIASVALVVCATYAGYLLNTRWRVQPAAGLPPATVPVHEIRPLENWSFDDMNGQERPMSEWSGDLIVVNFWATWCAPCRKEIPGFIVLQDRYAGDRVQFIGIAFDRVEAVRPYAEEQGINYPILIGEEAVARYMRVLGNTIGALPFSAIIGRDGRVLQTHQGAWTEDAVDSAIRAAL